MCSGGSMPRWHIPGLPRGEIWDSDGGGGLGGGLWELQRWAFYGGHRGADPVPADLPRGEVWGD